MAGCCFKAQDATKMEDGVAMACLPDEPLPLTDRAEAGRLLGKRLRMLGLVEPLVLALPRGGVPVAAEVATALGVPLDLLLVRKVGAPFQHELAMAAVVEGTPPQVVLDEPVFQYARPSRPWMKAAVAKQVAEIQRQRAAYLGNLGQAQLVAVKGRTVVLVDDGLATGTTARAAMQALQRGGAQRVVLAVPVAPHGFEARLGLDPKDCVCLARPEPFDAVGVHYLDFHQLTDDEVVGLVVACGRRRERPSSQ